MATSASQTYIARLGFQDRDRSNERHGLACEYLFERMLELEASRLSHIERPNPGNCINVPIKSKSYVNGFADVLISYPAYSYRHQNGANDAYLLGEVKITKEPAENVLQQINFYLSYIRNVETVYIVTDYDPGDLKRLCAGTKIKVYRLGQVFEQWLANRTTPATEEL